MKSPKTNGSTKSEKEILDDVRRLKDEGLTLSRIAVEMKMSRTTIKEKMKKMGIYEQKEVPEKKPSLICKDRLDEGAEPLCSGHPLAVGVLPKLKSLEGEG